MAFGRKTRKKEEAVVVEAPVVEEIPDYSKPKDQVDLTEEEKDVDIERCLSAADPNAPRNRAEFSYKERAFKVTDVIQHTVFHFKFDGWLMSKKCEEAKTQMEVEKNRLAAEEAADRSCSKRKQSQRQRGAVWQSLTETSSSWTPKSEISLTLLSVLLRHLI